MWTAAQAGPDHRAPKRAGHKALEHWALREKVQIEWRGVVSICNTRWQHCSQSAANRSQKGEVSSVGQEKSVFQ